MNLSFRLRLTLWYTALLAGALILFSVTVYVIMGRSLVINVDSALQSRADQMTRSSDIVEGRLVLPKTTDDSEGTAISSALVTTSGGLAAGYVGPSVKGWLASHQTSLSSGFHAYDDGALRLGVKSIELRGTVRGYVLVWQSLQSSNEAQRSLLLILLALGPALLVVAGLGGWHLASRSIKPVMQLSDAAAAISATDLTRRVQVGDRRDELGRLAATFNAMIDRLQSGVEREKRFTGDASHELRSPLTVIRAEASLALEDEHDPHEYRRILAVVDEQAEIMEDLIDELLLVARLESSSLDHGTAVHLADVVSSALQATRLRAQKSEVRIKADVGQNLVIESSPQLLSLAVRNILENAIKASAPGDVVRVQAWSEAGLVILTIQDCGGGVPREHREHIFEPFYQASPSRTPGESHGLGLAICRRIIEAHGGHVQLASDLDDATCFRIDLPAALSDSVKGSRISAA